MDDIPLFPGVDKVVHFCMYGGMPGESLLSDPFWCGIQDWQVRLDFEPGCHKEIGGLAA